MSIDLDEVKNRMDELIEIADSLPEKYQQKGFEVLLSKLIDAIRAPTVTPELGREPETSKRAFVIPIDVRAFLRQYGISEENLKNLYLLDPEDVRSIHTVQETRTSRAQIQVTLLTALENALRENKFEFSIENVRGRCRAHKIYNASNYMANFRNNAKFFKGLEDPEHVELSPDGKSELADIVLELTKDG